MRVGRGKTLFCARAIFLVFWLTRRRTAREHVCGYRKPIPMAHRNTGIKLVRTYDGGTLVQSGPIGRGADALRRMTVHQVKGHMESFYEHGTLPDLLLLCAAFDHIERERVDWSPDRAWLVDALLKLCA